MTWEHFAIGAFAWAIFVVLFVAWWSKWRR